MPDIEIDDATSDDAGLVFDFCDMHMQSISRGGMCIGFVSDRVRLMPAKGNAWIELSKAVLLAIAARMSD